MLSLKNTIVTSRLPQVAQRLDLFNKKNIILSGIPQLDFNYDNINATALVKPLIALRD